MRTLSPNTFLGLLVGVALCATVSAAEAGLYHQEVLIDNPMAYYRLEETTGPTASSIGLVTIADGSIQTGVVLGQAGPRPADGFAGFAATNNAPRFTAGEIDFGTGFMPTGAAPRTYELWFNADAVTPEIQSVLSYGQNAGGRRINISADNSTIAIAVSGENRGKTGLSLSGWNHLAITFPKGQTSTSNWKMYLNGDPVTGLTSIAGSPQTLNTNDQPGAIGENAFGSGAYYKGLIDEVAVYQGELSADRIKAHYDAAVTGAVTPSQTTGFAMDEFQTAAKNGESPATGGQFAGPLYIRERSNDATPEFEVRAFMKFDVAGLDADDVLNATLLMHETSKLNDVNQAQIFAALVTDDWDATSNKPTFDQAVDSASEFRIGQNGAASAGPDVDRYFGIEMTDWVKDWLSGSASNYGLRLRFGDAHVGAAFDESGDFAPRLIVTSVRSATGVIPEPSTLVVWSLLGGLGMGLGWRRQRTK